MAIVTRPLRRAARGLSMRLTRRAIILMYHRVTDNPVDPCSNAVTPRHVEEHLDVLRRATVPVPLEGLRAFLEGRRASRPASVITIDDGYAEDLLRIKPLLERREVPATLFVTTGAPGRVQEYWWDVLERVFLQLGVLPATFDLTLNGRTCRWSLGESARYDASAAARFAGWRLRFSKEDPTPRHALFRLVYTLLWSLDEDQQEPLLDGLAAWAGIERTVRPSYRSVSPEEIAAFGRAGLFEVAAHTASHPNLGRLSLPLQRQEIATSKEHLQEIVGRPVRSFAYPYGQPEDYTAETVALVRELGFVRACSTTPSLVLGHTDRYRLPRHQVFDMDGDRFSRWLRARTAA